MYERERAVIDEDLRYANGFTKQEKELLRECYLQKNSVETTAYKLQIRTLDVYLWYYRFTMALTSNALEQVA